MNNILSGGDEHILNDRVQAILLFALSLFLLCISNVSQAVCMCSVYSSSGSYFNGCVLSSGGIYPSNSICSNNMADYASWCAAGTPQNGLLFYCGFYYGLPCYPVAGPDTDTTCNAEVLPPTPIKNTGASVSNTLGDGSCPLCNGSDPINGATGNEFLQQIDYASANGQLAFERTYNSAQSISSTPLITSVGIGWQHTFNRAVYLATATTAIVTRADGKVYSFTLINGVWTADADIVDSLVQLTGSNTSWQYTTADHSVELYNNGGKLLSITKVSGYAQTLTYSDGTAGVNGGYVINSNGTPTTTVLPVGLLIQVTDSAGHSLQFGYNNLSQLVKMVDSAGGMYLYDYSGSWNLTSVTYPDGNTRSYGYGNTSFPYALTSLIDENGNKFASWSYDTYGRAISSQMAGDVEKYSFAYTTDSSGNSVSTIITDPLNTSRIWNFTTVLGVTKNATVSQPCSVCGNIAKALSYDANGNIASRTDFNGVVTTYT
ncbi:DUF6531 domain-containing protein, partial [Sulfuriferula thiophila]|uniref:DUF6531 domain-containing protein n=1 Tax=Sulfuriferula thiophila TaxID=1781211 RepID=UPI00105A5944